MSEGRPAPGLYLVATPIGNARDITLRALDVLRDADVIAAEDTRNTRRLLEIHGIAVGTRKLLAYHDHNGPEMRPHLLRHLADGAVVAYASDAGTPLVADPGYRLVNEAVAAGAKVTAVPGPSAVLAALSLAGLPTDKFQFGGFPPSTAAARRTFLAELTQVPATLIFFESAKRCSRTVLEMIELWGPQRRAAICRELTKRFEEVRRGTLAELSTGLERDPPRGEVVIVVDRGSVSVDRDEVEMALKEALQTMTVRDAADAVGRSFGLPRREIYQAALKLGRENG